MPLILKLYGLTLPLLLSMIIDWNLTGFTIIYYHGFTVSNALTWVFTHIKDIPFFFRFILKPCYSHLNEVTTICSFQKTYKLNWQVLLNKYIFQLRASYFDFKYSPVFSLYFSYSMSDNETPPISWIDTWSFADWRHHRAVTCLENVSQWNIRRDKKLGFQCHINTFCSYVKFFSNLSNASSNYLNKFLCLENHN